MTGVITFKESGTGSDNSAKQTTVEGIVADNETFVSSVTATNVYNGRTGRGLKLGASKSAASLKLTLTKTVKPTKITFTAMWYKAGEQSITVNGTEITDLTSEMKEYTVTYNGNTDVSEIEISTPAKRAYIGKVTVYYESSVANPTISGTTPFAGTTTVTLGCVTEGAKIYYTTDDSNPTEASTPYTEPFTLDKTATVKAVAINGTDQSFIMSKSFVALTSVANIEALNKLTKDETFAFAGDAVVVANPNKKHVYIKDATGSSLIYDATGKTELVVGSHIAPNWTGKVAIYNGLFEAVPTSTLTAVEGTPDVIKYDAATATDIAEANVNKVVVLKGVTYTVPAEGEKEFIITAGDATVNGFNQFGITIDAPVEGDLYDIVGAIGVYSKDGTTTFQFQPITITRAPKVVPVTVEAATVADLTELVNAEKTKITEGGDKVGDITINLAKDGAYTVSGSLEAPASITINGDATAPATIDATALTSSLVLMSTTPAVEANEKGFYPIGDVVFKNVNVKGLAQQLFYANKTKYLINTLTFENGIIQVAGGNKNIFDFASGGVVGKLDISKSTIYANPQHTGTLYSSQSGDRATDAGLEKQTISIQNSTLYNIAYKKNVNTHRTANQTWLEYILKNSIMLNCGKPGQFVRGLNGGQGGKNPTWDIDGNTFMCNKVENDVITDIIMDQSGLESTGDDEEPIKNSLVTNPQFVSAATGDFHIGASTQQAKEKTGDPRWLVEYVAEDITDAKAALKAEIDKATALLGDADPVTDDAAKALKDAIDKAQGVYETAEFNEILKAATEELKAAEEAYKAATSGITNIDVDADADNGAWYNLQGVRVEKPAQRGIYIHNGKKVVIK